MGIGSKKIAICVDSSAGFDAKKYNDVFIVPLLINENIDGRSFSYKDGVDITCDEVSKKLLDGSTIKTSSSIPGDIISLFDKLSSQYDEIMCFTAPRSISGTYNSWAIALSANQYKNVHLFEQTMVCAPLEWTIVDLIKARSAGILTVEFVNNYLKKTYGKKQIDILVPDLKYLVRGGRISKFSGNMVSIFQLQVTVTLTDTELKKFGVDGSVKRAIKRVAIDCFSELKKRGKVKRIAIFTNSVCDPKYDYKKFRDLVMQELKTYIGSGIVIEEHKLPPFIIAHVGPNYVGLAMEVV